MLGVSRLRIGYGGGRLLLVLGGEMYSVLKGDEDDRSGICVYMLMEAC